MSLGEHLVGGEFSVVKRGVIISISIPAPQSRSTHPTPPTTLELVPPTAATATRTREPAGGTPTQAGQGPFIMGIGTSTRPPPIPAIESVRTLTARNEAPCLFVLLQEHDLGVGVTVEADWGSGSEGRACNETRGQNAAAR